MKHIVTNGCSFRRQFRKIGITGPSEEFLGNSTKKII